MGVLVLGCNVRPFCVISPPVLCNKMAFPPCTTSADSYIFSISMKSPQDLAQQLARQWQRADWRERQLLPGPGAWPVRLAIGAPSAAQFAQGGADLRAHLQAWRAIQAEGPGQVQWQNHRYQGAAAPLAVPTHWLLGRPSEAIAAMARHAGGAGRAAQADYQALQAVLGAVDGQFHPLLLRRLALWRAAPVAEVITAARDTPMNPDVANAFALAIIATSTPDEPAEGLPEMVQARERAQRVADAFEALRLIAPGAGSYFNECDYFLENWQQGQWGDHDPRLAEVKRRYGPKGLFFVHHGVGSEGWSADGFVRQA